jgi:hypothetical protein
VTDAAGTGAAGTPAKRPTWTRHRFGAPAPIRDKWHRVRHEDEVTVLLEQGRISVAAYAVHIAAAHQTNDQLSDVETLTLARLAEITGRSVRSVSRHRRQLVDAGLEEHEHRCYRRPDGTIMGLPNRIRFQLPDDAAARVAARTEAAHQRSARARRARTAPKGHPTARAPQNHSDQVQANRVMAARHDARQTGRACPVCDGVCMVETPDGYVACDACDRTGMLPGADP